MVLEVFNSGNASELLKELVITFRGQPYIEKTLFSKKLLNVKAGDVLQVQSYGELTNPYQYNAMLGFQIHLGRGPEPSDLIEELTEAKGYNITPAGHHGNFTDVTSYQFKQDFAEVFLNLIVYSAASGAPNNYSHHLVVEQDYGNINGILFRQA